MPHFHFDVCTNGVIVEDEDGLDLLNAATARLEAVRAAAEMMKDRCADLAERAEVSIAVRTQSPNQSAPFRWRSGFGRPAQCGSARLRFEPAAPA